MLTRRSYTNTIENFKTDRNGVVIMKGQDFNKLVESIKEAGEVKNGIVKPSSVFRHKNQTLRQSGKG